MVRGGYGIFYMPSHVQAAGHSGSSGMIGYNTQSDMIVSIDSNRTPLRYIDNPFPDGFNLPPGNAAGRVDQPRPRHGRRHRRRLHHQPGSAHAAVEPERPARAAGEHHHRGGLHRQQGHRPADRRERPAVRSGRSVVPEPGHGAAGSGAEPVLRDHHQPVVAAALPDRRAPPPAAAVPAVRRRVGLPRAGVEVDLPRLHGARRQALRQRPQPAGVVHARRAEGRRLDDGRLPRPGRHAAERLRSRRRLLDLVATT